MENSPEQLNGGYDESNITVLEGLEAVRLRPGMYIGGVDSAALHHLVFEIFYLYCIIYLMPSSLNRVVRSVPPALTCNFEKIIVYDFVCFMSSS